MTVQELMVKEGFSREGSKKCHCPSGIHADSNPSALINSNNVYCFSCGKAYGIRYLESKFNVTLDKIEEGEYNIRKEKTVLFRE